MPNKHGVASPVDAGDFQTLAADRFEHNLRALFQRPSRPLQAIRLRYGVMSTVGAGSGQICQKIEGLGGVGMSCQWFDPHYFVALSRMIKQPHLSLHAFVAFIEQRTMSQDGIVGFNFTVSQYLFWKRQGTDLFNLDFHRIYSVERFDKQEQAKAFAHHHAPKSLYDFTAALHTIQERTQFCRDHFRPEKDHQIRLDEPLSKSTADQAKWMADDIQRANLCRPSPEDFAHVEPKSDRLFRVWAFGDAHVGTDLKRGRESLANAIHQSEWGGDEGGPAFRWDIALDMGDLSGAQGLPDDQEGREVVRQFNSVMQHKRTDIYNLCGNHDRSGLDQPDAVWWRKWVDPTGENTEYSEVDNSQRPYAIEGTWERYSFRVGNLLFLMMSDINEKTQTIGRGDLGGNPAGVVSGETFEWWKGMIESNPDSIIVSAHHYVLKETTIASGEWEGFRKNQHGNWIWHYHGYKPQGAPKGASFLYFVDGQKDSQSFEGYLQQNPGASTLWLAGHTHAHPDDTHGEKSHIETRWGCHFINVAALTQFHGKTCFPLSRRLVFAEGSDELEVECYLHTNAVKPQGWYPEKKRLLKLPKPFQK